MTGWQASTELNDVHEGEPPFGSGVLQKVQDGRSGRPDLGPSDELFKDNQVIKVFTAENQSSDKDKMFFSARLAKVNVSVNNKKRQKLKLFSVT